MKIIATGTTYYLVEQSWEVCTKRKIDYSHILSKIEVIIPHPCRPRNKYKVLIGSSYDDNRILTTDECDNNGVLNIRTPLRGYHLWSLMQSETILF
uniref:Uncharacterized protein n=1 Tax=viral metagenome TaxID=1070528 RepID=A0A6C0LYJ1_9ZZZZ